jgi:penicillin-binding protein 1A
VTETEEVPVEETPAPKKRGGFFKALIVLLWTGFIGGLAVLVLYVLAVSINFLFLFGPLPNLKTLENPQSELASELYSSDGASLGKYFRENRSPVEYTDLPKNLVDALVATEDIRFEDHSGIDFKGTFAIFGYVISGKNRGSSTITQQLAKNLFRTRTDLNDGLLSDLPFLGKFIIKTKEWLMAIKLERNYSKKEILTMYLNTVDFGSNAFGIKVAAKTFFNKTPKELLPQESAVLVGVLKAPSYYNPKFNPENSLKRRNTVLTQMEKYHFLSEAEAAQLKALPLKLNYRVENQNSGLAPYFRAETAKWLLAWCKENDYDLYSDGLKIYTTLDSRMQKYAEEATEQHMRYQQNQFFKHWKGRNPWANDEGKEIKNFIKTQMKRTERYRSLKRKYEDDTLAIERELNKKRPMTVFAWDGEKQVTFSPYDSLKYYKHFLHAGMMAMEPATGHIKAWVGGTNFKYFKYDHVKQGARQPGSTFKPIVYCSAIDKGYSPCYEVIDQPVTFATEDSIGTWTAQNVDGKFTGRSYTLRQALSFSINSITAFLMKKLGPELVVEYAQKLGITTPLDPVPPLGLGASDVKLYDMVGVYSTFINQGHWSEPFFITRIEDKNGNVLQEFIPKTKDVLTEETAYIMVHMLKGSTERGGTAVGLRGRYKLTGDIAAKTGTTSNYSDGWFMGGIPDLITGIWVGGEDRAIHFRSMEFGQGGRMAMPIWGLFMQKVYADKTLGMKPKPFPKPSIPLSVELDCSKSGTLSDTLKEEQILQLPDDVEGDI